jgi:WD40 repeat protein
MANPASLPPEPDLPGLRFVARPEGARATVAFVHGLGGHCYETWGPKGNPATFVTRLAADLPEVAIATFGYDSGLKRTFDPSKLEVEKLARIWAHTLRESVLYHYRTVGMVCHSLGGVLTMTALRHLLTTEPEWVRRLREREWSLALFLLGVPQHGTTTGGTGWASDELRALTYNESLVRANTEYWQSLVRQPEEAGGEGKVPISTFAVVSEIDRWVPQPSAGDNLPESQILRVALSHADLVKPPPGDEHPPYAFVLDRFRGILGDPGLPRPIRERLARFEAGRDMVFDRVKIDHVVPRPWLDRLIDDAIRRRASGYVHLEAQAGAGKSAYLARFLRDRDLPGFFFDASQGITSAAELHEALWVQLVARGLLPAGEPPEKLGTDSRVLRQLLSAAAGKARTPLVIVVDALDEAQSEVASPALLPVLPDGVSLVTSSRPEITVPAGAIRITIDVDADESHADVRRFVEKRSADADVRGVLDAEGWEGDRLVEEVSARAGGLFAYAHFVLSDLTANQLRLVDLERFSQGLDEYYRFTWERWQRLHGERFRTVLRPALAGVSMARAPASAAMVAAWTGLEPADVDDALRRDLRPWVTPTPSDGEARYRLYHQSVRDFLWQKAPALVQKARTTSAAHLLSLIRMEPAPTGEPYEYSAEHAVWHLLHDGQHQQAAALLFDLVFLARHRERAGNAAILAELLALQERAGSRVGDLPLSRLLHAWNDEAFAIEDTSHLLSQLSYRIEADPALKSSMSASLAALSTTYPGSWLRCLNAVLPRSAPSLSLRGHEGAVNHFAVSRNHLVSAGEDGTLRVWNLESPGEEPRSLAGHEGPVLHCALSRDGRRLVSASEDGTLRVWNLASARTTSQVLQGHKGPVLHCAISKDDRWVVSASSDRTLRVWDTRSRKDPSVLRGHEGEVNFCALSSDAARLVSASDDGTLRVWRLGSTDVDPQVLRGHEGPVLHCAMGEDERWMVSASADRTLRRWDLGSPAAELRVLQGHDGGVNFCALTTHSRLVSASEDGTLRVWDLGSPDAEPRVLHGHKRPVVHCALNEDGRRLVSASADGTLRVWDLRSEEEVPRVLRGHEDSVNHCELSEDGQRLVSASDDGTLRIWDLTSPDEESTVVRGHDERVRFCALASDDRRLVSASDDETLRLWDLRSPGEEPRVLRGHQGPVVHCAWDQADRCLVSASDDGTLRTWNLDDADGEPRTFMGHRGAVNHCVLTPKGRRLVSASDDATLRVWNLDAPGDEPPVIRGHKGGINHCALSRDHRVLVSASADATLRVWDLEAPEEQPRVLRGHEDWVRHCALTSDNRLVVSASDDATLRVWRLEAPEEEPRVLRGHEDWVRHCALTSDDRLVVSASDDATLRVWRLDDPGEEPRVLRGHKRGVAYCALTPDNRRLASASWDGTIRVWSLESGATLARFRAVSEVAWVGWGRDGRKLYAGDGSGRVWAFEFVEGQSSAVRA